MILGLSFEIFTLLHVLISMIALASGFVVLGGLLLANRMPGWTAAFLATTVLTSVTGFGFPLSSLLPSHIVGVISLVVLAVAIYAYYVGNLAGPWRWIYAATALAALYFNVFVGVAQAFAKIPAMQALAPTQSEPPFAIVQAIVLMIFVLIGIVAARRFHPRPAL
jgi:hypothetical protein